MKIINLVTQMEAGGAQGAAIRMSKKLFEKGHQAETWFLHSKRPIYKNEANVKIIFKKKAKWYSSLSLLYLLSKEIVKFKPEAIITYTHYANIIGCFIAFIFGVKIRIATQRNPSFSYPVGAKFLDRILGSTSVYSSIIAVSDHVHESFKSYPKNYKTKMHTIYNGIDFAESKYRKEEARKYFSLPLGIPLIITTGRLSYQKNHDFLIELVKSIDLNCAVVIAGDGELREDMEKKIMDLDLTNHVFLIGEIPPSDIPKFLACGDLFVFPSRFEAFGFSLVEAMASGLPVVANDIPALRYIVSNNGFLHSTDDLNGWKEIIKQLFADPNLLDKYSKQSKKRAKAFTLQNMVDKYLKVVLKNK